MCKMNNGILSVDTNDTDKFISSLTNEDAGELFKALFDYVLGRETKEFSNGMLGVIFERMLERINRDNRLYQDRVNRGKRMAEIKLSREK